MEKYKVNLICVALLVASLLCAGGCARNEAGPSPAGTSSTAVKAPDEPVNAPSPSAPVSAGADVHGVVAERLDVSSYTYLRIKTSRGDVWAAVPTNPVAVGTEVTIVGPVPMEKFESKALKRTFEVVMFGTGVQIGGSPAPSPDQAHAGGVDLPDAQAGNGHSRPDPKADLDKVTVSRARGDDGRTVAEVFAQSKALEGKKVSVHGKVVKVTAGVMERNFLHLRDGSGSDAEKNNDLVVTTTDEAKVNDVVTATGVVHTDKDFGAGYVYAVLVEDATLTK